MRGPLLFLLGSLLVGGVALAQSAPGADPADDPDANSDASKPAKRPLQPQPQGQTGPTDTTSGGAPPSTPQGDSPPGMQPRPDKPKQGGDARH
jgi:hypothetical protein